MLNRIWHLSTFYVLMGIFLGSFSWNAIAQSTSIESGSANASNNLEQLDKFKPPYPFTAEELWRKLLQVIDLPSEKVTEASVGEILGIQFVKTEFANDNDRLEVRAGLEWYFNFVLSREKAEVKIIEFAWKYSIPIGAYYPPLGMCINANKIKIDLERNGWKLISSTYLPQPYNFFDIRYQRELKHTVSFLISPDKNAPCMKLMNIFFI